MIIFWFTLYLKWICQQTLSFFEITDLKKGISQVNWSNYSKLQEFTLYLLQGMKLLTAIFSNLSIFFSAASLNEIFSGCMWHAFLLLFHYLDIDRNTWAIWAIYVYSTCIFLSSLALFDEVFKIKWVFSANLKQICGNK